jgi:hypothetical protein
MNGLVRELSREMARCAMDYIATQDAGGAVVDEQQLAAELFERAREWLDGQDVRDLMLRVLAKRW